MIGIASLCTFYMVSYLAIDKVLAGAVPTMGLPQTALIVNVAIALAFCVLLALHAAVRQSGHSRIVDAFRVHAANGFYVDALYRRLANALAS